MMPHLGVLASVHPRAAMEVFERDCLVPLGWCVAPRGEAKPGKPVLKWSFARSGGSTESGTMSGGELKMIRLAEGERATVEVQPERGFDMGAGPGKPVTREVRGGSVGIIIDARGRPLPLPADPSAMRRAALAEVTALELYPD
jgi:hypothetical protein